MAAGILNYAIHACGIALLVRYLSIWFQMIYLPRWIRKESAENEDALQRALATNQTLPTLTFVIPALDEYSSLGRTLKSLTEAVPEKLRPLVSFIVVTTEKEAALRRQLLDRTRQLCSASRVTKYDLIGLHGCCPDSQLGEKISDVIMRADGRRKDLAEPLRELVNSWPHTWDLKAAFTNHVPNVVWLHFNGANGNMAAQLNLGLSYVTSGKTRDPRPGYLIVYNADSIPSSASIVRLLGLLAREAWPVAAQLMCVPMLNFRNLAFNPYLAGAAIYQSRWALGYEFRMLRRASEKVFPSVQSLYHYCRGQGMTFRTDYLVSIGGFEERTPLEDLFHGYALSCQHESCLSVPVLEWTDSPDTLVGLVRQKQFWFSGMLDLLHYPTFLKDHNIPPPTVFRHFLILCVGFYREIFTWLVGPLLVALLVIAAYYQGIWWWSLLPLLNAVISVILVFSLTPGNLRSTPTLFSAARQFGCATIGCLVYSMSRNIGPILACFSRRKT